MDSDRTDTLEATLRETQREYRVKMERLDEIDDRALRISRTSILVVGFAASAVTVGGSNAVDSVPILYLIILSLSLTSTLMAAVLGVAKVTVTGYPIGVGTSQRSEIRDLSYSYGSALSEYIEQYEDMIREVRQEIRQSKTQLAMVQNLTMAGSAGLFVGSSSYILFELMSSNGILKNSLRIAKSVSFLTSFFSIALVVIIYRRAIMRDGE